MDNKRLKIVFPIVKKAAEEVIMQEIYSPNVAVAWAMKHGEPEKVTLEEVQEVLDMKIRDYITLHKETINGM